MPAGDLSGISELDEKQRTVLAQKLGITSCYELIMADRQAILDAFGRRIIRPTLEDVAVWQDEARRLHAASVNASASATAASGWEPAATFVVAFEERRRGDVVDRRIVAEQTEIEPEASPQQRSQWPDWACADACRWMLERLGVSAAVTGAAGTRSKIDIERAHLTDRGGGFDLVAASRPVPQDRLIWAQPARLLVTLGSAAAGSRTSVVLQLAHVGGRKHIIAGHLDDVGRVAEIQLSGLADGAYAPAIVAWTPDGSSLPCVVKLPTVEVLAR